MAAFFTNFIREYFDAQGRLTHYDYVYENNFNYGYDVTDALGAQYPERLALLWRNEQGEETRLTFRDIQRLSTQTANLLQSRGLRKGDVLLSALRCHWEHWIVSVAAHKLGVILAPVYYRLTEEDLYYRMAKAKAKAVLCCQEGECPAHMAAAADRAGVPLRLSLGRAEGFEDFHALIAQQPDTMDRVETQA